MCAAVMPFRHFTELKRRIFRPVRWCYFIRYTDKSKSCFALLCCFYACFNGLSPLLPCENCKNSGNKEIFTFSGKSCTKNPIDFLCVLHNVTRIYIIYIKSFRAALATSSAVIKIFNRFPLCYYYIASMQFCQAIRVLIEKYEYDGLHKYQTFHTFQMFQTTQPPGFSPSSLYSSARKLTIGAYIASAKS